MAVDHGADEPGSRSEAHGDNDLDSEAVETLTLGPRPSREGSRAPRVDDHIQRVIQAKVQQRLFERKADSASIGRFAVLELIGRGGMGRVYAAYDAQLDRKVAVKVLLDARASAEAQQRLQREAQAMARLSHPNVVAVHEVGQSDGEVFVAMEFIRGQNLNEWIGTGPQWRQVLEVFIQAGQGLAAAHGAGLVHRDLKPHNIMRGDDGVVKVLDFGLARAAEGDPSQTREADELSSSSSMLESRLSHTGTLMGTPAYMAPEQLRGAGADALSDQFSFCVALYEALYGERPYDRRSTQARRAAQDSTPPRAELERSGEVRPPATGSKVPAAVRKILLRGLSPAPGDRWPGMEELLEHLRAQLAPRRRSVLGPSLAVGLVGLGVGVGANQYVSWSERCTGAASQLEGIWDEPRKTRVRAALLETELSYARETWPRVQQRLDEYAAAWVTAHTEACEATSIRHEQSEGQLDLRMRCLQDHRQHLRATVDELARGQTSVVEHAVEAVTSLPALSRCADLDALVAERPPPEDPAVARRVSALDEQLVEAEAKEVAGEYAEALALTDTVVAEATALGYEPLLVRAWLQQGSLRKVTADYEGAVATLDQAYRAALAQRMTAEAASASALLVRVLGIKLSRFDEAGYWARHADPISRAAGTAKARASYLRARAGLSFTKGELEEAREGLEEVLSIVEGSPEPDPLELASTLENCGVVAWADGRYDEARVYYGRALAISEDTLGPDHPKIASTLHGLASVEFSQEHLDEAAELYRKSLAIRNEALGPDHPDVANGLDNLASILARQGKYEEAGELYARGLSILDKAMGLDHPAASNMLGNRGSLAFLQGEHEEARHWYEQALAANDEGQGSNPLETVTTIRNLGVVARVQGRHEQALAWFERALAIQDEELAPEHPEVISTLMWLGMELVTLQDYAGAVPVLERALSSHPADGGGPFERWELQYALARARWEAPAGQGRDRPRARMLAEQAKAGRAAAGDGDELEGDEVQRWLDEHPLP